MGLRKDYLEAKTQNDKLNALMKLKRWFEKEHFVLGGLTFDFGKEPTVYDVLSCLQKYDVGSLQDFCDELGYSDDSINAIKIYEAVVNEYVNVKMLWSDKEIELLQEVQ